MSSRAVVPERGDGAQQFLNVRLCHCSGVTIPSVYKEIASIERTGDGGPVSQHFWQAGVSVAEQLLLPEVLVSFQTEDAAKVGPDIAIRPHA